MDPHLDSSPTQNMIVFYTDAACSRPIFTWFLIHSIPHINPQLKPPQHPWHLLKSDIYLWGQHGNCKFLFHFRGQGIYTTISVEFQNVASDLYGEFPLCFFLHNQASPNYTAHRSKHTLKMEVSTEKIWWDSLFRLQITLAIYFFKGVIVLKATYQIFTWRDLKLQITFLFSSKLLLLSMLAS